MYSPNCHSHATVEIELLDHGMIVHYQHPVKQMKNVRRSSEPFSIMLEAMLPNILEKLSDTEDGEDWSEEKRKKKEMIQSAIEKAQELINPKPKECWVWSSMRVVVGDPKDLPAVIEVAKASQALAKKIQDSGEYINPSHAQLVGGFGDVIGGQAFSASVPPPMPMGPMDFA